MASVQSCKNIFEAAKMGHLACMQRLAETESDLVWPSYIGIYAACQGHLECLKFARSQGWHWVPEVTCAAARCGKLECLEYALEEGCPLEPLAVKTAALEGHVECIKCIFENRGHTNSWQSLELEDYESSREIQEPAKDYLRSIQEVWQNGAASVKPARKSK